MRIALIAILAAAVLGSFDAEQKVLRKGTAAEKRAAAEKIASAGTKEATGILLPFVTDEDRDTRLAALDALGGMRAFASEIVPVLKAASAKAPARDLAEFLWAGVRLTGPDSRAWLVDVALSSKLEILASVFDFAYRTDVIVVLSSRLPQSHAALVRLTGKDFGMDGSVWRKVVGAVSPPSKPTRGSVPPWPKGKPAGDRKPGQTFYGIPLPRGDFVFLLDASASMNKKKDGVSRIDGVKEEVVKGLTALPEGRKFNLVFFNGSARHFRNRLVAKDAERLAEAKRWLAKIDAGGGTNLGVGLRAALADPEVKDIVLLSDGRPTRGRVKTVKDVVRLLGRRKVRIHTIATSDSSDLMKEIAHRTGGKFGLLPGS